jgi:hypothetical protein
MPDGSITAFDIVAYWKNACNDSQDVAANGYGLLKMDSQLTVCTGDEPAMAGVFSGTVGGLVTMLPNTSTVRVNGRKAIRDGDSTLMNNGNTVGRVFVSSYIYSLGKKAVGAVGKERHHWSLLQEAQARLDSHERNNNYRSRSRREKKGRAFQRAVRDAASKTSKGPLRHVNRLPAATGKLRHLSRAINTVDTFIAMNHLYNGRNEEALKKATTTIVGIVLAEAGAAICAPTWVHPLAGLLCTGAVIGVSVGSKMLTEYLIDEALYPGPSKQEKRFETPPAKPLPRPT